MNIVEQIRRETAALPAGHIAVQCDETVLSYCELLQSAEAVAAALRECGVERCDRVGLAFPDGPDYIVLSLAILSLDAVLVPVPCSASEAVLADILETTDARFLLSFSGLSQRESVYTDCDALPGGGFFLHARRTAGSLPPAFEQMEPAFIRFSSGTTGTSKGVLLTHQGILERTDAADQMLRITSGDTVLWVLSMSFHFVVSILLFLRRGATIRLCGASFPFSFFSAAEQGEGTVIYATPFHYRLLTEADALAPGALSSVRLAVSTAMRLPADIDEAFWNKFGFHLNEAYGIIEVGLPFVNSDDRRPAGSVGRAQPGFEVKIRNPDETGAGEVLLRGPGLFAGYLHPWQLHAPGDWFASGDIGKMDADGFLYLLGRAKTVINFAGMKVFPAEVEAVLNRQPGVRAALVYGEAHQRYGQIPCARVEAADADPEALQRACYACLESYKVPKKIEIVEQLERTASGKIKRAFSTS